MLTSSLSACNCFISEKGGKMFILWNQNHDMKSKGADERKDAPGGVLSYFVSTVKKIHYPSVSLQNGRNRTTLFKNNLWIWSWVQHSSKVHSDCNFKSAGYKSVISRWPEVNLLEIMYDFFNLKVWEVLMKPKDVPIYFKLVVGISFEIIECDFIII